jgi:hypothetical protein
MQNAILVINFISHREIMFIKEKLWRGGRDIGTILSNMIPGRQWTTEYNGQTKTIEFSIKEDTACLKYIYIYTYISRQIAWINSEMLQIGKKKECVDNCKKLWNEEKENGKW